IFQRHVVLGASDTSRAGGNTAGLIATVFRDGKESARTSDPEAATGKIIDIVRHVADCLGAFGERLTAGQIIIAGSVTPPLLLEPTEKSLRFELAPIGSVSVELAR